MRPDQSERLSRLSESLTEVVLTEADPSTWTGGDTPVAQLTKDDRGDRYWCKKNAAATLALLGRVEHLLANFRDRGPASPKQDEPDEGESLEREIARAEAEASRHLQRVMADTGADAVKVRGHV